MPLSRQREVVAAVERILAARAATRTAAPDAPQRIEALCEAAMRNHHHLGAENVTVTVADVLAAVGGGA